MSWPNDDYFLPLAAGRQVEVEGARYRLSVVDCGELVVPSGKLVACDPFARMERGGNAYVTVPPGSYSVIVTLADVSDGGDGSDLREAYATLRLADRPEAKRTVLSLVAPDESPPVDLEDGEFVGFEVDAGTGCFVDDDALVSGMPPREEWLEGLFDNQDPQSWFQRMDDPQHIRAGIARILLPLGKNGENLVLFHSGWGDGVYPLIGGYDAAGVLVALHIDFLVVHAPLDPGSP